MKKVNKSRYALLGMLMEKPRSGYAILQMMQQSTTHFWQESDASVYPMLKILEEPPKNTLIIILAENSNQFLPTITSRCKIIELENKEVPKGSGEVFEIFDQNIGERFYLAQTLYEDKEAAVVWLEDQINSLREKAKKEKSVEQTKKFAKTIREFIEARRLIKNTNVNARLTLEHLFLNLD